MTSDKYQSYLNGVEADVQRHVDESETVVFVLGPDMNNGRAAGNLRRSIVELCEQETDLVVVAEHTEVRDRLKRFSRDLSLAFLETKMAQRSDIVILIPDSPGSHAELGYFSSLDDICGKMLVLFDKQHQYAKSYIALGPRKQARAKGAEIRFVDYSDVDASWRHVGKRIRRVKQALIEKRGPEILRRLEAAHP